MTVYDQTATFETDKGEEISHLYALHQPFHAPSMI